MRSRVVYGVALAGLVSAVPELVAADDANPGQPIQTFAAHQAEVPSVAFAPGGERALSAAGALEGISSFGM